MRHTLSLAAAIVAAAFLLAAPGLSSPAEVAGSDILVRLHTPGKAHDLQAVVAVGDDLSAVIPELGIYRLRSSAPQAQAIAALRRSGLVAYAEPNRAVRVSAVPNDPSYASSQWALQAINAPQAWDIVTGTTPITIAIIDTGIDLGHADLAGKIVTGATFVVGTTTAQDDHGHGTHVAGIAAARTNNGVGMAGVSWGALLMPVKVLDRNGSGTYAELINGIYYASTYGAQILNMSVEAEGYSRIVQDAIDYAHAQGTLLVASAGNCALGGAGCSQVNAIMYPAAYSHVVSVAATDDQDRRASFSTYNVFVDVAAPGVGIYSTHWQTGVGTYFWMSGTSQAAPHVAGLAALIWSGRPGLTNDEVEAAIEATALDINAAQYPGLDNYLGWGRINAWRAVDRTPPASSVLPLPVAQRSPQFAVSWSGQDDNSGLRSYSVQVRDGNGPWQNWQVNVTSTQAVFSGAPGHTYYFQSSATDVVGNVEPYGGGDGDAHIHISTCTVSGAVRDNRGVPVAGALVQLAPDGSSAISDEAGGFLLSPAVCTGAYSVSVTRDGFGALPPMHGVVVTETAAVSGLTLVLPPVDNIIANRNWGFESGALAPAWSSAGLPSPGVAAGRGHTGLYAAFIGTTITGTSPAGEASIAMTVTVPITAYRPALSFIYRIQTMDNILHDRFEVWVKGQEVLRDNFAGPEFGSARDLGWKHAWLDLSHYAGETVAIRFAVVQGQAYADYPTGAYMDEVSIGSASGGRRSVRLPVIVLGP